MDLFGWIWLKSTISIIPLPSCYFFSSLILHSFLTDLPGLGEKQNSVSLFEPQAQQWLHHNHLPRAFPVTKVLLLGQLIIRDASEQPRPACEQIRVVAHLPQSYEAWENLEPQGGELRLIHRMDMLIHLMEGEKQFSFLVRNRKHKS